MLRILRLLPVVLLLSVLAPVAYAQTSIAVVDMQAIMSESAAAKSILDQMKKERDRLEGDVKKMETDLKAGEAELIKKKDSLKPEEFAKERQAFEKKLVESRARVQKGKGAIDAGFSKAINELRKNLVDIVSAIATEKKINLVIDRQNVIIGDNSIEITEEVMKRLNEKVKTIKVNVEKK